MENKYNLKSPGVKRLMREACELAEPTDEYFARPLEDNLFEWHFTVRGPSNTEFEGGFYHGRILLPSQYPMQPPNIILLTPNGRFEVNKKICLSISGHHPESWQPSWSIRTALLALIAFMPTPAAGTIGSLDYTAEERQVLARKSKNWECSVCGRISENLSSQAAKTAPTLTQEESTLIQQIALKAEEDANRKERTDGDDESLSEPRKEPHTDSGTADSESSPASLRQRISANQNQSTSPNPRTRNQATTADIYVETEVTIGRGPTDKVLTVAMWVVLFAIGLLIFRRVFLL